jgi:hypothetical protein
MPALYQPVRVTVTVCDDGFEPGTADVEAWMTLPPTAAFINGSTRWRGKLGPLESHTFAATVAFVVEGVSTISGHADYTYPAGEQARRERAGGSARLRVDAAGGQLNPVSRDREPSYGSWPDYPREGSILLEPPQRTRILMVTDRSGWCEWDKLARPPAELPKECPWGYSTGSLTPINEPSVELFLFDQPRPSTGYHLTLLRFWYSTTAKQILMDGGVGDPERVVLDSRRLATYQGPPPVLLDLIATAPRADWPVETRPVLSYQRMSIPKPDEDPRDGRPDERLEFVVRVNGQIVGRQTVVRGPQAAFVEFTLDPFQPRPLP